MNLIQANELRRQEETHDQLELLSHLSPGLPPVHPPLSPTALESSPADPESVHQTLRALRAAQNSQDRDCDSADLRQLMRTALDENDDFAMFEVFQIARSEMPEAIKVLQRALERVVEGGDLDTEENTTALPSPDTLDREFIETGIDSLQRLYAAAGDFGPPSWTITHSEIDLEEKIGIGFFSDVYRGTWRNNIVAIKMLSETTLRKIFLREVGVWKSLYHPNVLELLGASSASGDPPSFLVREVSPP